MARETALERRDRFFRKAREAEQKAMGSTDTETRRTWSGIAKMWRILTDHADGLWSRSASKRAGIN